jgi:Na+-transporting NADH:ubiquinone oxidoreductase subunit F
MVLTLPVREVTAATPRAAIVRLDLNGVEFPYRAGQAVLVGRAGAGNRRPYSLAAAPDEARQCSRLEILVGVDERGSPGAHLPELAAGVRVDVEGPVGSFHLPAAPKHRDFLFVAGGTGIAPLRAMLHEALARREGRRLAVLYSARRADEFAYADELKGLAGDGAITLRQTVTGPQHARWAGTRGRITRSLVEELAGEHTLCFVCGPHAFVEAMVPLLRGAGAPPRHIHVEDWGAPEPQRT